MRAWTYTQPGLPNSALTFTSTHPSPLNKPLPSSSVLIKISHTGFNGGVIFIMQLIPAWLHKTPAIPELDLAGAVVAAGSDASSKFPVGIQVFGSVPPYLHFLNGSGSLAEYVVPCNNISAVPAGMAPEEAAALSGCGCTAVQLVERGGIKRGDNVLINGGSGGLGSILVQVVKEAVGQSGRVIATCSAEKVKFVKGLGADEVIDYRLHAPLAPYLTAHYSNSRFDCVLDTVGVQELYVKSPAYLSSKGIFINAGGMLVEPKISTFFGFFWMMLLNMIWPAFLPGGVNRRYAFLSGAADPVTLAKVKKLVEDGKLKVPIDSMWAMEDVQKAYERMTGKGAKGKVIVHVQDL